MLFWDLNGFWLFYRRLERGTFQWPTGSQSVVTVTYRELSWLLDGTVATACRLDGSRSLE
ncbi:IS66 family insertion sequence element accessory protein TnpB [Paenibacillus polymyxa]|uniref:IS66 family insertion sequence element accessory protein TnpB n=1 Tax=Paenibacillus polymyxa TaxID=1406 RepID=UPI0017837D3C|nr:hypothetical protein DI243_13830 [Paenibacillus polymyxa]